MLTKTSLTLTSIALMALLTACSDKTDVDTTADSAATETPTTTTTSTTAATSGEVEIGMSVQEVTDLLGPVSFSSTRTIDSLTIVHSEWTTEKGVISVQFHNDKVQFTQFAAN
ncbi:MAG: hypothetical protein COA90_06475 [Gammaproteobacteria bacterium]|nr:MAG: hypothetical protein COA90_06475 [Gammaproteobacteria bacterium]